MVHLDIYILKLNSLICSSVFSSLIMHEKKDKCMNISIIYIFFTLNESNILGQTSISSVKDENIVLSSKPVREGLDLSDKLRY